MQRTLHAAISTKDQYFFYSFDATFDALRSQIQSVRSLDRVRFQLHRVHIVRFDRMRRFTPNVEKGRKKTFWVTFVCLLRLDQT